MRHTFLTRFVILLLSLYLLPASSFGVTAGVTTGVSKKKHKKKTTLQVAKPITKPPNAAKTLRRHKAISTHANSFIPTGGHAGSGPWTEPTFADSTVGDKIDGEDLVVRRAAVDALGPYNGTVVVADPSTGRILTIVNQKLAFRSGFQPCSTIKIVAALAGLSEGIIDRNTAMRLYGRTRMNLTNALAHSNNNYFANVGIKLGFEKVNYYARLFGLGEKAGLNIEGEQAGMLPAAPPKNGGMGMMTSFGEGITLTPLQLTGLISAVANGGTLYYLQHPTDLAELEHFIPRVKRHLAIQQSIPEVKPGMMGAVEYGTARRANYDPNEPIFGKTGTCTDSATPTHLGWFGSFNDVLNKKLSVVVLLTGGRPVSGPVAAGIAGNVYRNLSQQKYFGQHQTISPIAMVSPGW